MEYINGFEETKNEETDIISDIDNVNVEMKTNDQEVDKGIHIYGETVSQNIDSTSMLDFIFDLLIQHKNGTLPKSNPEEVAELLTKWFDGSLKEHVESELHEQSVASIESGSEQCVRNIVKRQRVDSDV